MTKLMVVVATLFLACGAPTATPCAEKPACHTGNWRIVSDRYQLCDELGQWEDGGPTH